MSRILCTSSKPNFTGYYSGLLDAAGHRTTCVNVMEQAASELPTGTFDLVITDLSFPQDTVSLVKIAKQQQMPVVLISRDITRLFRKPYADLYLEPPVAPKELLAIVKELLSCRPCRAEERQAHVVAA